MRPTSGILRLVPVLSSQTALLPTTDAVSDAELVARALVGDRWSRDVLYRRHVRYLLAIASRLLSNRGEGEEVVQDTFVVAFAKLGTLRDPAALRSWLARIAVTLVQRRMRKDRLLRFLGLDRGLDDATLDSLASSTLRPDERAELALADRVLRRLPTKKRIAWMLRRVEGLPLIEVAAACDCSQATVKRQIAGADAEMARYVSFGRETP
jgi:RNA polymerase sigma-70 factor, ECF subfamily